MKKYFIFFTMLIIIGQCAVIADETKSNYVESVRSFTRPSDARFQYSFPDKNKFTKKSAVNNSGSDDLGEVVLDTANTRPQKKIIKSMSADSNPKDSSYDVDNSNVPMNYDNFPKYYDSNNMMQNQIMPMLPMGGY